MKKPLLPAAVAEFLGTFFLVLIIGLSTGDFAPLAIGLGLAALIYGGAQISGAHYNPAVTLGFMINGTISRVEAFFYVTSQLVGASAAAILASQFRESITLASSTTSLELAFVAEALFTFLLMITILNVACHPKLEGNQFFGLAIGFVVITAIFSIGDVSGAALNPAVAFGIFCVGGVSLQDAILYLSAPTVGAVLATALFKLETQARTET